jgi:hypothetical protein
MLNLNGKKKQRLIEERNVYSENVTMCGAEIPVGCLVCKAQTHASDYTYGIQGLY